MCFAPELAARGRRVPRVVGRAGRVGVDPAPRIIAVARQAVRIDHAAAGEEPADSVRWHAGCRDVAHLERRAVGQNRRPQTATRTAPWHQPGRWTFRRSSVRLPVTPSARRRDSVPPAQTSLQHGRQVQPPAVVSAKRRFDTHRDGVSCSMSQASRRFCVTRSEAMHSGAFTTQHMPGVDG